MSARGRTPRVKTNAVKPNAVEPKPIEPKPIEQKALEPVESEKVVESTKVLEPNPVANPASDTMSKLQEMAEQVSNAVKSEASGDTGSMKTKIAGFLFVAGALALFGLALNKGMKYAVEQPYWKVIHTEITKNIGISFAMMFLFFVVSIIYYLQDTASGIQNLFVLLLFVFLLSFSAISLGIVTR